MRLIFIRSFTQTQQISCQNQIRKLVKLNCHLTKGLPLAKMFQ